MKYTSKEFQEDKIWFPNNIRDRLLDYPFNYTFHSWTVSTVTGAKRVFLQPQLLRNIDSIIQLLYFLFLTMQPLFTE